MASDQEILATATGQAPAGDNAIFVAHAGHQTLLDAADPMARAAGYVGYSDDPIGNRVWRAAYAEDVQRFILTGSFGTPK